MTWSLPGRSFRTIWLSPAVTVAAKNDNNKNSVRIMLSSSYLNSDLLHGVVMVARRVWNRLIWLAGTGMAGSSCHDSAFPEMFGYKDMVPLTPGKPSVILLQRCMMPTDASICGNFYLGDAIAAIPGYALDFHGLSGR